MHQRNITICKEVPYMSHTTGPWESITNWYIHEKKGPKMPLTKDIFTPLCHPVDRWDSRWQVMATLRGFDLWNNNSAPLSNTHSHPSTPPSSPRDRGGVHSHPPVVLRPFLLLLLEGEEEGVLVENGGVDGVVQVGGGGVLTLTPANKWEHITNDIRFQNR